VIELIPKKEKTAILPPWFNILFYAAIVVFALVLLVFFILNQLKSAAKTDLEDVRNKIEQVRSPERLALEAELLALEKRIKDVAFLLASHQEASKFFTELEKLTHPRIQFTEISLDNPKSEVRLSGLAEDFTAAEQQFRIFNESNLFKEVKLSGLSFSEEEGVKFQLSFTFDPRQVYR